MPETGPYDTSLVGGDGLAHVELLMQRWFQSSRLIGSQNCWGWKTSLKIILLNLVPQFKQGQPENIAQNWFWFLKLYLFWKYLIVAEYCTFSWEREKKKKVFWREVLADFVVWYLSSLNKNGLLLFSAAFYLRKNWSYFLAWKSFMDLTKFSWTIITNSPLTNMLCKWSVSWLQPYAFSFKIVIFQAPEKLKGSCFYSLSVWDLGYVKKV